MKFIRKGICRAYGGFYKCYRKQEKRFLEKYAAGCEISDSYSCWLYVSYFDQHIVCSWLNGIYPAYSESSGINTEFQLYTLNYLFGLSYNVYEYSIGELAYNIRIDVFRISSVIS